MAQGLCTYSPYALKLDSFFLGCSPMADGVMPARVANSAELWTISPRHQAARPVTVSVLVRMASMADSVCDDSRLGPAVAANAKPPRRGSRAKAPPEKEPPLPKAHAKRKRTRYFCHLPLSTLTLPHQ